MTREQAEELIADASDAFKQGYWDTWNDKVNLDISGHSVLRHEYYRGCWQARHEYYRGCWQANIDLGRGLR